MANPVSELKVRRDTNHCRGRNWFQEALQYEVPQFLHQFVKLTSVSLIEFFPSGTAKLYLNLNFGTNHLLENISEPSQASVGNGQGVIEDGTTATEIKIVWTNPITPGGGIKVSWGQSFEANLTSSTSEYIFRESAPGTPLTAGQSGTCKVTIWGSGDCSSAESTAVEIQNCDTKGLYKTNPEIAISKNVGILHSAVNRCQNWWISQIKDISFHFLDTNLVVRETITANSISLDCTLENGDDLSIGTATLSDSNSVPVQGTNDASTAAASHTLKWQNLSPNSKYYLSLTGVMEETLSKTLYNARSFSYCTC